MQVFFIRYRKSLLFGSVFLFLYSCYETYRGVEKINSSDTGAGMGILVDACVCLLVSIYLFTNVRNANKTFREENTAAEAKMTELNLKTR
jgi:hypothetical protein